MMMEYVTLTLTMDLSQIFKNKKENRRKSKINSCLICMKEMKKKKQQQQQNISAYIYINIFNDM